jgi:hypothetical protein
VVRRLGRSQQLLVTALAEQETVAVQAVVENHLGRRPTRSELHAAQRSAHLLAQRGGGTIRPRHEASSGHDRPTPAGAGRGKERDD